MLCNRLCIHASQLHVSVEALLHQKRKESNEYHLFCWSDSHIERVFVFILGVHLIANPNGMRKVECCFREQDNIWVNLVFFLSTRVWTHVTAGSPCFLRLFMGFFFLIWVNTYCYVFVIPSSLPRMRAVALWRCMTTQLKHMDLTCEWWACRWKNRALAYGVFHMKKIPCICSASVLAAGFRLFVVDLFFRIFVISTRTCCTVPWLSLPPHWVGSYLGQTGPDCRGQLPLEILQQSSNVFQHSIGGRRRH